MAQSSGPKDLITRRNLVRGSLALTGTGMAAAALAEDKSTQEPSAGCVPRGQFIFPESVPSDGAADARPGLQALLDAVVGDTRPIVLNGIYRLDGPLKLSSNHQLIGSCTLRANHSGALLSSAERPVARVRIDGLRLEAQASFVSHAIHGECWQYARLENLRLLSAGGVFRTGIRFSDVAYWNTVRSLESDCTLDLFDLGDANNLVLDDINLCRFSDIGIRSFLRFHAPCSGVVGRALSVEGVFRGQTLVKLDPECAGIDLEFLRVEGRAGSSTTSFLDFNGARANRVVVPQAYFGLGGVGLLNEEENMVIAFSHDGSPAHRFGRGQLVLPSSEEDPSEPGALTYHKESGRFRAMVNGARSLALSPAVENIDMHGHAITGVDAISLQVAGRSATISLDARGRVVVRDEQGAESLFGLRPGEFRITGSRADGSAFAALLKMLQELGIAIDATHS